jgi:hypothetical protein
MLGLSPLKGFPVNPNDMRALSKEEIAQQQIASASLTVQATMVSLAQYEALSNYFFPPQPASPEKPLDERFADFKVRLAKAIAVRAAITSA